MQFDLNAFVLALVGQIPFILGVFLAHRAVPQQAADQMANSVPVALANVLADAVSKAVTTKAPTP